MGGCTRADLVDALGVDLFTIALYESGERIPADHAEIPRLPRGAGRRSAKATIPRARLLRGRPRGGRICRPARRDDLDVPLASQREALLVNERQGSRPCRARPRPPE
jgi:hypothetical protein